MGCISFKSKEEVLYLLTLPYAIISINYKDN